MNTNLSRLLSVMYCIALLTLFGCETTTDTFDATFDQFIAHSAEIAGVNPLDCGETEIDKRNNDIIAVNQEVNVCIADAFQSQQPAFAVYGNVHPDKLRFDQWNAVIVTNENRVHFNKFEVSEGGREDGVPGIVLLIECVDPELKGSVDGYFRDVFDCSSIHFGS